MSAESADPKSRDRAPFEAARVGAFVDAVAAIAMTLLILPLMDSVSDVASSNEDTALWFTEHYSQLTSFVISFVLIAMFWMMHHRIFVKVKHVSDTLLWTVCAWLLTIVWLPVATAISGQMSSTDVLAKVVYIGSMLAVAVCSLMVRINLHRHPGLHDIRHEAMRRGVAVDIAMIVLFAVSLGIAVLVPAVGYFALFALFLTAPLQTAIIRLLAARDRS